MENLLKEAIMKKILVIAFILLFSSLSYGEINKDEVIKMADETWAVRDNTAKATEALNALKEAIKAYPEDFELLWRYARLNFWFADSSDSKDAKAKYGKEGYLAGQKAATIKPDRVEGYFWGVASLGMYSEGIGILKSIKEGNKGKFEEMLNKALKIDRTYEGGGPIRTQGRFFARLPWPLKDTKKGLKLLDECISLNKKVIRALFYKAEIFYDDGEYKQAKEILNKIITEDFPGDDEPEKRLIKKWAERLMKKVDEKLK
jgi:tetratricopeptide (TPR) repeat protein